MSSPSPLPRILELKRTLFGREKCFDCQVLSTQGAHLIVLFVALEAMQVHDLTLPPRTVTFGHFWGDRPYNVYHWLDGATGRTLGFYVNLSRDTHIEIDRLEWLDLVVDVLVLPNHPPRILDEDEIPADATPDLLREIADAKATVLAELPTLLDDLERDRDRWWETATTQLGSA